MALKLYEIDEAIYDCFNEETGEFDEEKFQKLQGLREEKLEGIAIGYKTLLAEVKAIKEEEGKLAARRKVKENKAAGLKEFLAMNLHGEKLSTARVNISWRESESLEVYDEKLVPDEYIKTETKTSVDKKGLTKAIKEGKTFAGMALVKRNNIQIG